MKWILAASVALSCVEVARADIAPFTPPGTTFGLPIYRIEVTESFPEYVFLYYRYSWVPRSSGSQSSIPKVEIAELSPASPLLLPDTGGYRMAVCLLVVSREIAAQYATTADILKALDTETLPVVASIELKYWPTVTPIWRDKDPIITYRVQRTKSGDGLEIVRTSWDPLLQWYVAVAFLTLAIVWGGIRFVSRKRRAVPVMNSEPPTTLDPTTSPG
ncbi:MAG: hypothetical protein K8U57_01035 [Planctomycetes bacterium]|nr:hypothetical protein [Planctomycetota bacterium]